MILISCSEIIMSFFPIISAPGCNGWVTIYNFPPNNWEAASTCSYNITVTWSNGKYWNNKKITELSNDSALTINSSDLEGIVPAGYLPFLSLTRDLLPERSDILFSDTQPFTKVPSWRATIGLTSECGSSTSYQGEIDILKAPGSCLSFGLMVQQHKLIENHLIFINLESSPLKRSSSIKISDCKQPNTHILEYEIVNNSVSSIPLDNLFDSNEQLALITCREMSGIPFIFSSYESGKYLSLEHTHPPASLCVHGDRWSVQRSMKNSWFSTHTSI